MNAIDHLSHGGRTGEMARKAGIPEAELLDFSANVNPAGPPPWLDDAIAEAARRVHLYPDPDSGEARDAAERRYGAPREGFVFADGADSLIMALPRALRSASCVLPFPTYSGSLRSAAKAGVPTVRVALDPSDGFSLSSDSFARSLDRAIARAPKPALVMLGSPNNPAGGAAPRERILAMASTYPEAVFAVDESFAELAGEGRGLIGEAAPNLAAIRSLTKTWAVPGARIGFAYAAPALARALRSELPAWPVSCFAQAIAARALSDGAYAASSAAMVAEAEAELAAALSALGQPRVHRGGANFMLLEWPTPELGARAAASLLRSGIAVRTFSEEEGLDKRYMRVAVRRPEENARLVKAIEATIASIAAGGGGAEGPRPRCPA